MYIWKRKGDFDDGKIYASVGGRRFVLRLAIHHTRRARELGKLRLIVDARVCSSQCTQWGWIWDGVSVCVCIASRNLSAEQGRHVFARCYFAGLVREIHHEWRQRQRARCPFA